ncbi:MAG: glutathione peroxidase [Halioglobus sp.]|nr:glutathione peroxidase [Halioglobus sp.]
MARIITMLAALYFTGMAGAACPDYLNSDLRKLHSQDTVNLCQISAGQALLIVNTASHCGYTNQFKGLQELNDQYRDQGLKIVGFASDDFRQEADNEAEVADICYVNYGVTFTMIAPSGVRGDEANPIFRELAAQSEAPSWNFNKYVVDSNGRVVKHFGSSTSPDSPELKKTIESIL